MAHFEQQAFLQQTKDIYPRFFKKKKVLEIGSLNINGTARDFFKDCDYIGVDVVDGNGVDLVGIAHELDLGDDYDVIVSCESMEHDPNLDRTIQKIKACLKKGGLLVGTAAGINRYYHTDGGIDYFRPIEQEFIDYAFSDFAEFESICTRGYRDIYFRGIK